MGSFTDSDLLALVDQKLTRKEIAKSLNTSVQSIHVRLRKLKINQAVKPDQPLALSPQPADPPINDHKLTPQEQIFIDHLLNSQIVDENGEYVDHAYLMKLSGYVNMSISELTSTAAGILERFILQTEDRRRIFRHLGAHEIAAARGLLDLARNDKSGSVKLQAWTLICKVLGILKDNNEVNQPDMALTIFKTEITKRYETVNVFVSSPNSPTNHTANSQKRYDIEPKALPAAIVDPESNPED